MSQTMFSIVVPLYNKERFISRCIDSVLSQSEVNYELIVVDDGSTDKSLSIVSSYDDKRVKIITQENAGVGPARNKGVVEASGEWVAFLDADDVWAEDHLAELKKLIEEFEYAGIVSTRSTEVGVGKVPSESSEDSSYKRMKVDYFRESGLRNGVINSSSVAIRRTVFNKVGFFKNIRQGEDTEFWSRVCLVYPCAVSEKPTSFYCRGTGGIMEQNLGQKSKEQCSIHSIRDIGPAVSYLLDEMENGNLSDEMRDSVAFFINSRITTALRILLYSGRVDKMPMIGTFYLRPLSVRSSSWQTISRLPRGVLIVSVRRSTSFFLLPNRP